MTALFFYHLHVYIYGKIHERNHTIVQFGFFGCPSIYYKSLMGRRMTGHKTTGANGTGTATFYKETSQFVLIMMDYVKKGSDPYFTLQAVLDDASSGRGTERVTLYDVNFDSAKIAGLDVDSEALEEEVPFTFEDFDVPEQLKSTF